MNGFEVTADEYRGAVGIAALVEYREQRFAEAELIDAGVPARDIESFMWQGWRWSVPALSHPVARD